MLRFSLFLLLTSCGAPRGTTDAPTMPLFDFTTATPATAWKVEDDVVMGGRSEGHFDFTEAGYGRFYGEVSLENNGGFSSVEHVFDEPRSLEGKRKFVLRVRGDGKDYNFRVQRPGQRHSYRMTFSTTGEWQTVEVPFAAMEATFRGETPDVAPFTGEPIRSIRFLIGNKKEQQFELLIDWIEAA